MPSVRPPPPVPAAAAVALVLLATALAVPAAASPAPVSACPPCDRGFTTAAGAHGLDTDVAESAATVRVHRNGSATWTARVVPTNDSALDRLAANATLARRVAGDSFGVRYGDGVDHDLLAADVRDGAFVIRYRTLDVVRSGPLDTHVLTYFRDSPGAYVYTDLGADRLTVVAPEGSAVARGFGEVGRHRMTATALPEAGDGPFVVFAPADAPAPGARGAVAVLDALGGVILRNLALFALLPSAVLVGGLAGVRRAVGSRVGDPARLPAPARSGVTVAGAGALLALGTLSAEADALPSATGNLLVGSVAGAVLVGLGVAVAVPRIRRALTVGRLLVTGGAAALAAAVVVGATLGASGLHATLTLGVAVLPAAVALGRADARTTAAATRGDGDAPGGATGTRLLAGLAVAAVAALAVVAPLRALGGTLFLLVPLLTTVAAAGTVVAAVPLYLLGAVSDVDPTRDSAGA